MHCGLCLVVMGFLVCFLVSLANMQFLLICLCCGRSEFCGVACTLQILCTHFNQTLDSLVRVQEVPDYLRWDHLHFVECRT